MIRCVGASPLVLSLLLLTPGPVLGQDGEDAPETEATAEEVDAAAEPTDAPADEMADESAEVSGSEEEARALFAAGRAAFESGQLARALEHFERAYELSHRPVLLFNIGNTHDRLRNDEEAIQHLTQYLEEVPDAANAELVRARLEVLRESVAAREREAEQHAEERERLIAEAHVVDATLSDVGIALMIGGGVGLLVMAAPAAVWGAAERQLADCQPRMGCDPRPIANRQDAAMGGTVALLVASVLAGGGGIVLFAVSPRPSGSETEAAASDTASATCAITPTGLGCRGRF